MANIMHIIKFVNSHPLTWATQEFLLCGAAWGQSQGHTGMEGKKNSTLLNI